MKRDLKWLEVVYKRHNEWIKMVNSFGYCPYPEDVVSDMYLELTRELPKRRSDDKRVNPDYVGLTCEQRAIDSNGSVSSSYIWLLLRRFYDSNWKQSKSSTTTRIGEGFECYDEPSNIEQLKAYDKYRVLLDAEIQSWTGLHRSVFTMYFEGKENKDINLVKLAGRFNTSIAKITYIVNECKRRIVENVGEDYQDYLNKDYELIK